MKNQTFAIDADALGLIGTINLVEIDWKNRNACNGIMLGIRILVVRGCVRCSYGNDALCF